jgi:hypothetical protein
MSEYRGFKYQDMGKGCWQVVYPYGHKFIRQLPSEDAVKELIDSIISSVGGK